ncbi:Signal peptide peptidase-like 3 [Paramecium bursaria]
MLLLLGNILVAQSQVYITFPNTSIFTISGNSSYQFDHPECCTPPSLAWINENITISTDNDIDESSLHVSSNGYGFQAYADFYSPSQFYINVECDQDSSLNSGMITFSFVSAKQKYKFSYWFQCGARKIVFTFDWSMILLIFSSCFLLIIMGRFTRILSLKITVQSFEFMMAAQPEKKGMVLYYQGFKVSYWYMILYLFGLFLYYVFLLFIKNSGVLDMTVSLIVCSLFGFLFVDEFLCWLSATFKLKYKLFWIIRVCDILSLSIIITLVVLYTVLNKQWYFSCIFAFLMMGASLKLFKFTSLRSASFLLVLCIIFDLLFYLFINLERYQSFNAYILIVANYPFLVEFPLFQYSYLRTCCWLSILDLILPGMVIAYLNRFDRNRNSNVYTMISILGLFFGTLTWILVQAAVTNIQFPQSIFVFPYLVGGVLIWAQKQGDLNVLWEGTFYDKFLYDPFYEEKFIQENELKGELFKELFI